MSLTSAMDPVDDLPGGLERGDTVLETGDVWIMDLPHLLSVRAQLEPEAGGMGSRVLWLDGANSFNPYRIGEVAREFGIDPDGALEKIYLSRAFTCYQMSSLVLEKLQGAVEEHGSKLVVVTGLPSLYLHSDIPRREAVKAFDPVVEELGNRHGGEEVIFLMTSSLHSREKGEIRRGLESIADLILNVEKKGHGIEVDLAKHPDKPRERVIFRPKDRAMVTLEEYGGE